MAAEGNVGPLAAIIKKWRIWGFFRDKKTPADRQAKSSGPRNARRKTARRKVAGIGKEAKQEKGPDPEKTAAENAL